MLAAVLRTLRDPTALDSLAAILERRRFGGVIARKRTSAARLEAAPRTNRRDVKGRDMTLPNTGQPSVSFFCVDRTNRAVARSGTGWSCQPAIRTDNSR